MQRPEGDPAIGPKQPPEEVERLSPRALSFWISSLFHESQLRQQSLLEVGSGLLACRMGSGHAYGSGFRACQIAPSS